ncbi:unnamed protein product [Coregonus sp. 'balchen']|nr:unnamed protein product [Coregonus sp. 'balchen']
MEEDGGEPREPGREPNTIPASWAGEMEEVGGHLKGGQSRCWRRWSRGASGIIFVMLNVRGIREDVKRRAVFGYLEGVGFDVCFVQEVHLRDSWDAIKFKREWDKGGRSLGQLSERLLPVFFSDHDGVLLQFGAPVCLFGRGYWKLELEVLDGQAFVKALVDFFRGLEGLRVLDWWEIVKVRMRVFIIGQWKKKKREERREVDHIQRLLELELEAGNLGWSVDWERSTALKAQLREVHERKARAFLMRAHSGFIEHDETCSAEFFKISKWKTVGR